MLSKVFSPQFRMKSIAIIKSKSLAKMISLNRNRYDSVTSNSKVTAMQRNKIVV